MPIPASKRRELHSFAARLSMRESERTAYQALSDSVVRHTRTGQSHARTSPPLDGRASRAYAARVFLWAGWTLVASGLLFYLVAMGWLLLGTGS